MTASLPTSSLHRPPARVRLPLVLLERGLEMFSAVMVAVCLFAVVVQVVMRYGLNDATTWSDTVASCSLVWIAFLSVAAAVRSDRNLAVRFVILRLGLHMRRLAESLCHLVILGFALTLMVSGLELMALTANTQVEGLAAGVSWADVYSISVVSGGLMAVFSLEHIAALWVRRPS